MKSSLFLVHWNTAEADEYAGRLKAAGWDVAVESKDGGRAYDFIRHNPPDVTVIYLTKLPSHGRQTAVALHSLKSTRAIPIVFVDGTDNDIRKTREKLPEALFTTSAALVSFLSTIPPAG